MSEKKIDAWYGRGGSLVSSGPIDGFGMTELDDGAKNYYGASCLVCESLSLNAARTIALKLGLNWVGEW